MLFCKVRKILSTVLAAATVFGCTVMLGGCESSETRFGSNVSAAVMSSGRDIDEIYDQLVNGIIANLDVTQISSTEAVRGYDMVYLDESLAEDESFNSTQIVDYVYSGGTVVLDNKLLTSFGNDFLGAADIVPITGCPVELTYPDESEELKPIRELIYDYTAALKEYTNYEKYAQYDYGYGIIPSTATLIAAQGDNVGVYTMNHYGSGYVFVTNPMLPSDYTVSYLREGDNGEQPLAFSTTGAENLLRSYYAEFVSQKKFGFSVERTFGSFGTRPAAWELHYEDITGVANNSLKAFSELCMKKGQMPSYTTARNIYTWFKRAESVTYLKNVNGMFKNDFYENAYCSGTHVVSGGKWLELDSYDDTDSYFVDDTKYVKRAYPYPYDRNGDGNIDIICGSADGKFYYFEGYGMKTNYETSVATLLTDSDGDPITVGAYSSPTLFDLDGDGLDEIVSGSEGGTIYSFHTLANDENKSSLSYESTGPVLETGMEDSMVSSGDLNGDGITDLAVGSRTGEIRVYYGYTEDGITTKFGDYITVESREQWGAPCIYNGELYSGSLEGYIVKYKPENGTYVLDRYLEFDDVTHRGNKRISIGMNSVPRFADLDGDGADDLICGSLEYGMAYPIDSEYFPYKDELKEQFAFCDKFNIYMGVHSYTHKYATPEHEQKEMEYHKNAFAKLGLTWDQLGANQHTWYTSKYGYDGSNMDGYNPSYNGTFASQYDAGLLWNSGSTLPESDIVPQSCAEDAIPMPVYMPDKDFLMLQTSNTPHGKGEFSYMSVKYDMPMLFYNHCDYIYEQSDEQLAAVDKVGELVDTYDYVFVGEKQMAMAVSAAYNTQINAYTDAKGDIIVEGSVRDKSRGLYDKRYSDCVGVKVVFATDKDASDYAANAKVWSTRDNCVYASLGNGVRFSKALVNGDMNIKQVNIPAKISVSSSSAEVTFKDSGLMLVRVAGRAKTSDEDWTVVERNGDTLFMKFGQAQSIKITR